MVTTGGHDQGASTDWNEQALVTRRASEQDGRGRVVALTERGREVIDAAFTEPHAQRAQAPRSADPAKAAQMEKLLINWLARFEQPDIAG